MTTPTLNTARALLLMHGFCPDAQILETFAEIIPNYDANYFQAVAYGLQREKYLEYSPGLKQRRLTDEGRTAFAHFVTAIHKSIDAPGEPNVYVLIRSLAPACRIEHAQWVQERTPVE